MKTLSVTKMLAGALILTVALTFSVQRKAHAGDAGKLIAAAVVGAIVYEALDNDNDGWRNSRHRHTARCDHNRYDRPRAYRGTPAYPGWNTPLPTRNYGSRYDNYRGDIRYDGYYRDDCDRDRHGQLQYRAPSRRADVRIHDNRRGTRVSFDYRDRDHR